MREIETQLKRLDGQNYGRYRSLQNTWKLGDVRCRLTHIQADPYAPLSTMSIRIPMVETRIPEEYWDNSTKVVALCDFIHRVVLSEVKDHESDVGDGNSGLIHMEEVSPCILRRSAVQIKKSELEIRIGVGLPGERRKIMARLALETLGFKIPEIWTKCAYWINLDQSALRDHLRVYQNQILYRKQLEEQNLIAWIANGSVLARSEGLKQTPLEEGVVPFEAPETMSVTLKNLAGEPVIGMGISKGLTLIAGGGYHGKSTLLHAVEQGVYNHIPGDGREGVVCVGDAFKVKSEEGRRISKTDLSSFLGQLPQGISSECFVTANASGSTSQFANLIEAYEVGARTFLIDEDMSAVNALVRDNRVQKLLEGFSEPITPLIDRMPSLKKIGVNLVIVVGASGVYLDHADSVVIMKEYVPVDATLRAQEVVAEIPGLQTTLNEDVHLDQSRRPDLLDMHSKLYGLQRWPKIRVQNFKVSLAEFHSNCHDLDQICERNQLRMTANAYTWMVQRLNEKNLPMVELLRHFTNTFNQGGFDSIQPMAARDLVEVRPVEISAFINRLNALQLLDL